MPQDNVEDIREVLMAARSTSDANPVFYGKSNLIIKIPLVFGC